MGNVTSAISDEFNTVVKNYELMAQLRHSELDKDELAYNCGLSTKTVYRRVKKLMENGLVTKDGHHYSLTNIGELHTNTLENNIQKFKIVDENREVFSNVDSDIFPGFLLSGAEVSRQNASFPKTFAEVVNENLRDALNVRAIFGHFSRRHFEILQSTSVAVDTKVIIDTDDYSVLENRHPDRLSELRNLATEIRSSPVEFPHSILKIEGQNTIIELNSERGHKKALLTNSCWKAQEWAANEYASYTE